MNSLIRENAKKAFSKCFDESHYVLGDDVEHFEKEYASFNKTRYCISTSNGLDALHIALLSSGVEPGDEVIVPAHTFIATFLAVTHCGAIPVPVDADPVTMNIDTRAITKKISEKTSAIIPVHLYGQSCKMDSILSLSEQYHLPVIEDNAQAQGASFNGQSTGGLGLINATSFYPAKNLGALGDAGAITTNDSALAQKAKLIRNYGSKEKYIHDCIGFNSRLDTLQASLLRIKLKHLEGWNRIRTNVASIYDDSLQNAGDVILPKIGLGSTSVYHQYVIRTSKRELLRKYLTECGVETLIHYPVPPHLQKAYKNLGYKRGDFPETEKICNSCLSLPIWPGISNEEVGYVIDCVKSFFR